jgi:hypothetical protein
MRGNELVKGNPIRVYDNGGKTFDRYTVVYMNREDFGYTTDKNETFMLLYPCYGLSENPFHPQGFGLHSSAQIGKHLGKRIKFSQLPEDCRKAVMRDLSESI